MKAVLLDSDDFDSKAGDARDVEVKLEFQIPFEIDTKYFSDQVKDEDGYTADDDDVIVRGPVYVGNSEMLDRHNELVAPDAILSAWENYAKNPVILYNHSKDAGVIGKMLDVEMGQWDGIEGSVPIGRALIDGGEKSIVRKIRKGLLRAFSIGFIARAAVKECKDDETCYLTFTEIDWLETSVVDVPASPNALFNVEKHIIGYEDMGDAIAILFEKMPAEDTPSEEPPAGGDLESPVEESAKSSCGCSDSHIEADTPPTVQPEIDEIAELRAELDGLKAMLSSISPSSESQESESEETDSLNTPLAKSLSQPQGNNTMTDDTILESEATEEVLVEGAEISEPVIEEPALNVKSAEEEATEEAAEEVVEAAEEVAEEELPEEVVEEVAEATEEESAGEPTSTEVLFEVVKVLSKVEGRLSDIENHIKSSEDIESLKSELESIKAEKEAAEAEANIEAEVAKRVAELVGTAPTSAPTEANPKSLSSTGVKENKSITRHDPTPTVSKGMNGLAGWLESQIASRGA
jgi:HK97 family phage prohead protease